jgi:hypothetical protein
MIKIQKLDCSSSGIDFCIFPVVKIHTVGVSVTPLSRGILICLTA